MPLRLASQSKCWVSLDAEDTEELCLVHSKLFLPLKMIQLFMHIVYLWEVQAIGETGNLFICFIIIGFLFLPVNKCQELALNFDKGLKICYVKDKAGFLPDLK